MLLEAESPWAVVQGDRPPLKRHRRRASGRGEPGFPERWGWEGKRPRRLGPWRGSLLPRSRERGHPARAQAEPGEGKLLPRAWLARQTARQALEGKLRRRTPCVWTGRRTATALPCQESPCVPLPRARLGLETQSRERPAGLPARLPWRTAVWHPSGRRARGPSRRPAPCRVPRRWGGARRQLSGSSAVRACGQEKQRSSHLACEKAGAGARWRGPGSLQTAPG